MTLRIALIIYVLAGSYALVAGQTAKDIEALYGQRDKVYTISDHLWMSPSYASDGQVCLMRVYPKRVSADTNYLDDKVDMDEALKFINKLVPIETRGARRDGFGMSDLGGGVVWTGFRYEHIEFVFISTFRLDKLAKDLMDRPDEVLDFPIDDKALADFRRQEALQPDDELIRKYAPNSKVLEIHWPSRQCVRP